MPLLVWMWVREEGVADGRQGRKGRGSGDLVGMCVMHMFFIFILSFSKLMSLSYSHLYFANSYICFVAVAQYFPDRCITVKLLRPKCVLPASAFPSPEFFDNLPERRIVYLNAVRFTRSLSTSYFCMYVKCTLIINFLRHGICSSSSPPRTN